MTVLFPTLSSPFFELHYSVVMQYEYIKAKVKNVYVVQTKFQQMSHAVSYSSACQSRNSRYLARYDEDLQY
jgi:hypothetical protein